MIIYYYALFKSRSYSVYYRHLDMSLIDILQPNLYMTYMMYTMTFMMTYDEYADLYDDQYIDPPTWHNLM